MREKLIAFFPIANVLALTGLLAAILLFMGLDTPLAAAISLWFCFVGLLMVYFMGRKPLKLLSLHSLVAGLLVLIFTLASLLTLTLLGH